jgi:NitT/TauT family transport system substrate-binding protein
MAYAPSANGLYTNNSLHTRNRGSHVQLAQARARSVIFGRLLRRSSIPLAVLSLALAAAGCHVPGISSGSVLPSGQTLTVAVVPGIDTVPLEVAVQQGLFKQQGIGVTIKDYASVNDAFNALMQGKADVADGDYTSYFYAIAKLGASLRLIADGYDASAGTMQVLALPSSGIDSPVDLEGKVVATVLQTDGVPPSDITWDPMPQDKMITALKDHQVNAIVATDPLIIQAETQLGAQEVLDACSGVTANLPLSGYFSTASFAKQHDAALQAFQGALTTAESDSGQRSNVQSVLRGESMTTLYADLVNIGQYPAFLNVGQVQRIADLMYDSGMITTPVTVQSLLAK